MEHLNYCRQIAMLAKAKAQVPSLSDADRREALHLMDLCAASQKFLLPFDGKLLDDAEFRALDDSVPLRLPHQLIALEFRGLLGSVDRPTEARRVVFCSEDNDDIFVWPFAWLPENGTWATKPTLRLPKVGYMDRTNPKDVHFFAAVVGRDMTAAEAASHDVATLLGFCNALACSNVRTERSEPKKFGKKIKAALPFDAYHVLTIDVLGQAGGRTGLGGPHRSPREHLRRGHIRRLADGRRIWVNATVVAAGRGGGTVTKDYALRAAA